VDVVTPLGRATSIDLDLLRVGPRVDVHSVASGPLSPDQIVEKFATLFQGVGLLKNCEIHLHIDKSVKPVAQPVRRIPFQLRDKVDAQLDQLIQQNIIKPINDGPTSWVSPLVVAPKPNGDVRICVDMRRANQAIIRERHPMPTVEDLLYNINGSTVFSKVDVKMAYHQVALDESSRDITTFVTHRGLFRY